MVKVCLKMSAFNVREKLRRHFLDLKETSEKRVEEKQTFTSCSPEFCSPPGKRERSDQTVFTC